LAHLHLFHFSLHFRNERINPFCLFFLQLLSLPAHGLQNCHDLISPFTILSVEATDKLVGNITLACLTLLKSS
jgi:hypothetical protein